MAMGKTDRVGGTKTTAATLDLISLTRLPPRTWAGPNFHDPSQGPPGGVAGPYHLGPSNNFALSLSKFTLLDSSSWIASSFSTGKSTGGINLARPKPRITTPHVWTIFFRDMSGSNRDDGLQVSFSIFLSPSNSTFLHKPSSPLQCDMEKNTIPLNLIIYPFLNFL